MPARPRRLASPQDATAQGTKGICRKPTAFYDKEDEDELFWPPDSFMSQVTDATNSEHTEDELLRQLMGVSLSLAGTDGGEQSSSSSIAQPRPRQAMHLVAREQEWTASGDEDHMADVDGDMLYRSDRLSSSLALPLLSWEEEAEEDCLLASSLSPSSSSSSDTDAHQGSSSSSFWSIVPKPLRDDIQFSRQQVELMKEYRRLRDKIAVQLAKTRQRKHARLTPFGRRTHLMSNSSMVSTSIPSYTTPNSPTSACTSSSSQSSTAPTASTSTSSTSSSSSSSSSSSRMGAPAKQVSFGQCQWSSFSSPAMIE